MTTPAADDLAEPRVGISQKKSLIRIGLVLGFVLLVVALAMAGISLLQARNAAQSGVAYVHRAQADLSLKLLRRAPVRALDRARNDLSHALSDFNAAAGHETLLSSMLPHLSWIPSVGAEVAASPAAIATASKATTGALDLVRGLHPLALAVRGSGSQRAPVSILLAAIASGRNEFKRSCTSLQAAKSSEDQAQGFHAAAIASQLHTFQKELPRLLVACRALQLLPGMLGANKPITYLVAYQNPDELRASGGFIGSAGLVTVRNGQPKQDFTGTWLDDNLTYQPPEPISTYNHEPGWLFRDSNWSPDFPTTAALERFFLNLDLHRRVQAVVDVTPQAGAKILAATGPVYLPEYHRWVSSSNVAQLANYYSHISWYYGPLHTGTLDTQRKQFIAIVGNRLTARLRSLSLERLVRLSQSIASSFETRDLQVAFTNPHQEDLLRTARATGQLSATTSDYLYVVDSNLSYNKINPYVHESVSYRATIMPDRWVKSDLTLRYTNVPAPAWVYSDSYGPGAGTLGGPADYGDFIRIYVPNGARISSQSGWTPWSPGPAYGKTMFSGYLIVRLGQTRVVHIRYITPPNVFTWSDGSRYRLVIQHQAGSELRSLHVAISVDGRTARTSLRDPRTDWIRTIGVRKASILPIPLPRSSVPVVSPGNWLEPGALLGPH